MPDDQPEPIRTFTVATTAFNPHLDLPVSLRAALLAHPTDEVRYETRSKPQAALAASPATTRSTSFLSPAAVLPGSSGIVYGLTVTATSAGYAEVVLDLDGLSLESEASIPTYWARAATDAPNTLTYRTTMMSAGDAAVFSLHLKNTGSSPTARSVAVNASVNGALTPNVASARLAPTPPRCLAPSDPLVVVSGVATALKGVQCTAPTPVLSVKAGHGAAAIDGVGIVTYTAAAGFTGPDVITVTAVDTASRVSEPVTLPVTVGGIAVSRNDDYTVERGQTLTVPAAEGILADDTLTGPPASWPIQLGTSPSHGTVRMDNATGAFVFDPEPGFVGDTTFRYLLRGTGWAEGARSTIATVTIHVQEK